MICTQRLPGILLSVAAVLVLGCNSGAREEEVVRSKANALCGNLVATATPASPVPQNSTMHLTASATCDVGAGEFAFAWQSNSAATFGFIQNWSSSRTADWNTTGFNGAYNLYAYTRQAGNPSQDALALIGTYQIGRVCDTVALSVSPAPASNTSPTFGTPVTLTGSAGCRSGGTPVYQFFYIPPGTNNYIQVPQAGAPDGWGGASATLDTSTLNNSTLGAGKYTFFVHTRAAGNDSSSEGWAYGPLNYYIGDVCPQLTQTLSPPNNALVGSNVTLSASTLCLRTATPEYKFAYKLASASTFTDIGDWQTAPTANWNTAGLAAGSYTVQAFGRARGNKSPTEGYSQLPYTLTGFAIATNGASPQNIYYGGAERSNDGAKDLASYFQKMSGPAFPTAAISGSGVPTLPGIYVVSADVDASRIPSGISVVATPSAAWPTGSAPTYREAFVIQQVGAQLWLVSKTALGVRHAVNRLLNELGYRYFFQGKHWEVIPSSPTLVYSGGTIADQPRTVTRLLGGDGWNDPNENSDRDKWRKRNGLYYDYVDPTGQTQYMGTSLPLGINQGSFGTENHDRLPVAANNPLAVYNMIAQVNLGNVPMSAADAGNYPPNWFNTPGRYGSGVQVDPRLGHTTVEVSNSDVVNIFKQWVKNLEPAIPRVIQADFKLEPTDGTNGGISRSAEAIAIGNDADQLIHLSNDVFADQDIIGDSTSAPRYRHYASMLAGYYHSAPPTRPLASPALYVGVMPLNNSTFGSYTTDPDPAVPTPTARLIADWRAKGASVGVWRNCSSSDMGLINGPHDHTLGAQSSNYLNDSVALAKEFRDEGVAGSVVDIFETQDNFGPYGIGYYLTARLSWNYDQNVSDLRQDFFRKAFPASWTVMQQYFDLFDPKNQPLIITDETLGKAVALLKQAGDMAAGATDELGRIYDLKAFIHHNALWWTVERAPHCSGTTASPCDVTQPQVDAVKLLSWDYQNRFSYMTSYATDQTLAEYAYTQFGNSYFHDSPQPWLPQHPLSDSEIAAAIDGAFVTDQQLFHNPASPVQQTPFTGDPVVISGYPAAINRQPDDAAFEVSNVNHAVAVAMYTNNGSVTLKVRSAAFSGSDTFPADFPSDQLPSTHIWLTDTAGNQLYSTTGAKLSVTWAPQATATRVDQTFANIARPPNVTTGNFGVVAHVDTSGYYSAVWIAPTSPLAWLNDKLINFRPNYSPDGQGYYFYVPKCANGNNTCVNNNKFTDIKFTWDRAFRTDTTDKVSLPLKPPQIYDDQNVLRTNDGDSNGFQSVGTIPVNPDGGDHGGKLWRVVMGPSLNISRLWFYNLPNYFTVFPQTVVLPRDLANAEHLTIAP